MQVEYLYGVRAVDLDDANAKLERAIGVRMVAREGLHNGGDYYALRSTDSDIKLRENIDLDDTEMEFDGMHEPDFSGFRWLLYIEGRDIPTELLAALDNQPNVFVKLRVRRPES
jgi:hypothetical protein